jgi:hypothetical protein
MPRAQTPPEALEPGGLHIYIERAAGTPSTALSARFGIPVQIVEHIRVKAGLDPELGAPGYCTPHSR